MLAQIPFRRLCVKETCSSTNRIMYTPLLGLWESGRGGRVSSTTRSDAARPRRRGQPTYRAGRQSSALEQEDVIAVLGLPSSRPGGPGLGRWPATSTTARAGGGRKAQRAPARRRTRNRNCASRRCLTSDRSSARSRAWHTINVSDISGPQGGAAVAAPPTTPRYVSHRSNRPNPCDRGETL